MMKKSVLMMKRLTKIKGENKILNQFFLEIFDGEIVNLIGLEGSGKEEIYSILFGAESADSGDIWFAGKKYCYGKGLPVEQANGIFFIGNNELAIPDLSVAENLYIIERIKYFQWSVSKRKMEGQAKRTFEQFGVDIDPGKKAKELSRYETYILKLIRAYVKRAKLIVIDDILDDESFEKISQLSEILHRFKQEGISILWIHSYPDEIAEIADSSVIIRDGRNSSMLYRDEYNKADVLKSLVGNENVESQIQKDRPCGKEVIFQAKSIENDYFEGLTFDCKKGEILGIYDLQNKFSRELRRLLSGRRSYKGDLFVDGKEYLANADYKLVENKIGVVDGSKYQELIFKDLSIQENIEIAAYEKTARWGIFVNQRVKKYLDRMGNEICENSNLIKEAVHVSRRDAVQIIYHRLRLTNPKVLFCFQPFLRLDAVSRKQLEEMLLEFQQKKMGMILSSADMSDLLPLCSRILMIEKNKIIYEAKPQTLMKYFQ